MAYPATLDDLNAGIGASGNPLSSPNHITQHTNEVAVIEALETKVGIDNSAVTTTIDYKLKNSASVNPGHKHSLLAGISDVAIVTPVTGNGLIYNQVTSKWENGAVPTPDASTTVKGLSKINPAPASATEPIALGANFATKSGTALDNTSNKIIDEASGELLANKDTTVTLGTSDTKYPSQKAVKTYVDTQDLTIPYFVVAVTASSNIRTSSDGTSNTTQTSYTKVKEILFNEINGTITITFNFANITGPRTVYARIYVNGVAVGTERTTNDTPSTPSENITVVKGDLIQLYAKVGTGGDTVLTQEFRLKYDKAITYLTNTVNL